MTDTFDAVLAEMDEFAARMEGAPYWKIREWASCFATEAGRLRMACDKWSELDSLHGSHKDILDRLAAAHAAEVAERDAKERESFQLYVDANEARIDAEARAEAAERDARRYRWLRDARCGSGSGEVEILIWRGELGVIANDADRDLNAAIDAAIATTGQADED